MCVGAGEWSAAHDVFFLQIHHTCFKWLIVKKSFHFFFVVPRNDAAMLEAVFSISTLITIFIFLEKNFQDKSRKMWLVSPLQIFWSVESKSDFAIFQVTIITQWSRWSERQAAYVLRSLRQIYEQQSSSLSAPVSFLQTFCRAVSAKFRFMVLKTINKLRQSMFSTLTPCGLTDDAVNCRKTDNKVC